MFKSYFRQVILFVAGLLVAIIVPAQNLPVLSPDGAIKTGTLPNGTAFYVVSNTAVKGVADFALVQRTGTDNIPDSTSFRAVSVARDALSSLPRCGGKTVQEFFASHGATPGREGFVSVTDNSTEFRFSDVVLSGPEVLDSALLVLMDVVDRVTSADDPFISRWYAPSDQAVVVAGDVDAESVVGKLKMLSYMTPSVQASPRLGYVWEESDTVTYEAVGGVPEGLVSFTAVWNSARTPREYMNTVHPVIYEMFLSELGMLAEEYLSDAFRMRGIPFADISCMHRGSLHSSGDETFSVSMIVGENDCLEAVATVAEVMGGIDAGNTAAGDLARVKTVCMNHVIDRSYLTNFTNQEYVRKCIAAFLYNGSLSTLKTKVDFLAGRELADSTELRLFNNVASAVLDPERNLTVYCSPAMDKDSVLTAFSSGWTSFGKNQDTVRRYAVADIPEFVYEGAKMKVASEKPDHMSGGVEWTFSNGFKVVYRKMPVGGRICYNLALNGGYGSVDDLEKGEGGYFSDYFRLSRIHDIPAEDFLDVLESEGMSMDVHVGLSNMMISGAADEDDLDLVMTALLAVMNGWETDEDAVRYYEACEPLRNGMRAGTEEEKIARIGGIMCPDYRYMSHKVLSEISPALSEKAERLFKENMRKTNDGVMILLGNLDESAVRKKMLSYAGGFRTTDRAFRRDLVRYQPSSGWSTYTVDGDRNSVDIAMSVPMAMTADNHMVAEIASMVLRKNLSEAIAGTGMYLTVSHECRIYPNERVNFHISLSEISPDGFSSDVVTTGPIKALGIVRSVLSGISGIEVSEADVEIFKARLKTEMKLGMEEPFYWLNAISRRHLAGKDLTTGYESRIGSVNVQKVKDLLSDLGNGTGVEYIVSRK